MVSAFGTWQKNMPFVSLRGESDHSYCLENWNYRPPWTPKMALEAEEVLKWAKKLSSTKNAECSLRAMLEHVTGQRNLSYRYLMECAL